MIPCVLLILSTAHPCLALGSNACGSAGRVNVWESSSGRCLHCLEGPGDAVEWLAWHPRGDVLLAGSEDFTAWMWNASLGTCMQACSWPLTALHMPSLEGSLCNHIDDHAQSCCSVPDIQAERFEASLSKRHGERGMPPVWVLCHSTLISSLSAHDATCACPLKRYWPDLSSSCVSCLERWWAPARSSSLHALHAW